MEKPAYRGLNSYEEDIMRIGVIAYDRKPLALDGRDVQNIGDIIQMFSAVYLLRSWGIEDELEYISRYYVKEYNGEYVLALFNCFNELASQLHTGANTFPISEKIIPVYMSFHLHNRYFSPEIYNGFKKYEPIGCRDEETMRNFREKGIKSYLSGCITALLPKREKKDTQTKIICVDIPESLKKYIPKKYESQLEYMSHIYPIRRTEGEAYTTEEESKAIVKYTEERLRYYRDSAALVITSRLHVASPCMAMGIPVILAAENFDGRFAWIDKYLPLYTPEQFENIDWDPQTVEYEEEKEFISGVLKKQFFDAYEKYSGLYDLSSFYENRNRKKYNQRIIEGLDKCAEKFGENIKVVMWGNVNLATIINGLIKEFHSGWTVEHMIDLKCTGTFEGLEIEKPECVNNIPDDRIFFVIPPSAHKAASEILENAGKKYVLVNADHTVSFSWDKE